MERVARGGKVRREGVRGGGNGVAGVRREKTRNTGDEVRGKNGRREGGRERMNRKGGKERIKREWTEDVRKESK